MKTIQWFKWMAVCAVVASLPTRADVNIDASGRLSSNGLLVRAAERKSATHKDIGVDEFEKLSAQPNHVVIDVRTPKEFAAGHLPGAVNIDFYGSDFETKIKALDKSKNYLVHCAVGGRSAKAAQKMTQLEFGSVYNLKGGFKAWEKAGKKVGK
jgi:rhodanese-related sulfurtransferase